MQIGLGLQKYKVFLILALPVLALANCSIVSPKPTETPLPTNTHTPRPTRTPEPTLTPLPSITPTPTNTLSPTPTVTPTPLMDFSQAKFFTAGFLPHWEFFIAVKFPGSVKGEYYAIIDENKDYRCTVIPNYPDRLYCSGPLSAQNDYIDYVLFDKKTDNEVFRGKIFVPLLPAPKLQK